MLPDPFSSSPPKTNVNGKLLAGLTSAEPLLLVAPPTSSRLMEGEHSLSALEESQALGHLAVSG